MARLPMALPPPVGAGGAARPSGETIAAAIATPSSSSSSVTETINGSHNFTIAGYSLAKGMGVGKYITSDTFSVGGYQWAIYFYPDGKNAEDNSLYVSVFIALASEGTDVRALFELTLLDQSGKEKHKVHSHFDRSLESGPYTLKYRGSMWYLSLFISFVLASLFACFRFFLLIHCVKRVSVLVSMWCRVFLVLIPMSYRLNSFDAHVF